MARPPQEYPLGYRPAPPSARQLAYRERGSPPPPYNNDGRTWVDRAWEARDKAQDERQSMRERYGNMNLDLNLLLAKAIKKDKPAAPPMQSFWKFGA